MPLVWRLAAPAHARSLDGEGARRAGGRWNSPGRALVYTSSHLSLSVLEVFAHIPPALRDVLPMLEAVHIAVPDDAGVTAISASALDVLLEAPDPLSACRAAGDGWLAGGEGLVLEAPSVLVPEETNLMLNPRHARMREVRIVSTRPFRADPRLGGRQ